ncbi:MAG TPA: hypothetical protein VF375_03255 [Candidatus Limnocylindrales bacterium]
MSTRLDSIGFSKARIAAVLIVLAAVVGGCVGAGAGPSGSGTSGASGGPSGSGASGASGGPSDSASVSGFYLRAFQTQALAPQHTFGWFPTSTVSDGQYIDGMIAIPAIYPGPLYTGLPTRSISPAAIAAIIAEARKDGMLDAKTDFTGQSMPGSVLAHVVLTVDGMTHDLTGPLPAEAAPTSADPGTTAAFELFWSKVTSIGTWLAPELGTSQPYVPTSIAVLVTPPTDVSGGGIAPTEKPWPLAGTFATFGKPYGGADFRCSTVTGADLATLLPVVQASNQLTRFVDSSGAKASIQVVALVPGDPGPCA